MVIQAGIARFELNYDGTNSAVWPISDGKNHDERPKNCIHCPKLRITVRNVTDGQLCVNRWWCSQVPAQRIQIQLVNEVLSQVAD